MLLDLRGVSQDFVAVLGSQLLDSLDLFVLNLLYAVVLLNQLCTLAFERLIAFDDLVDPLLIGIPWGELL